MECPRCDTDIGHDVNYCRSCGLPIGKLREAIRDWNCPRCEIEFEGQPSTCPECGLKIEKLRERVVTPVQESTIATDNPEIDSGQTQPSADDQHPPVADEQASPGAPASPGPQQAGQPGQQTGTRATRSSGTEWQPERTDQQSGQRAGVTSRRRQASQSIGTARRTYRRLPVVPAVVAGVVAYVVNYVVFFVLLLVEFPELGDSSASYGTTEFVGWFLYNAHQVEIEGTTRTASGETRTETINFLVETYSNATTTSIPDFLYYLVPMVVLYVAALSAVRRASPAIDRWQDGAALGVPLAGGYAVATLLGALTMFSVEVTSNYGGGSESIQPELLPALLIMGIAYPVIIGGIAGAIGSRDSLF